MRRESGVVFGDGIRRPFWSQKRAASSVDSKRNAVARGIPVRRASSLSDRRRSWNVKVLSSSSALSAASTV
jgi:hypothetical protein